MPIYLLRHADHGQTGTVLTGRTPGIGLSETGRRQAMALAGFMARRRLDAVVSSPQQRARETARSVAGTTVPLQISAAIDEIDFGRWAGQSFAALEPDPEWRRWNAGRDHARTPGGETMHDVAARATALIGELARRFPGGSIALVTHSDVIKACICHYRGRPFQTVHDFEIAPASVTTLSIGEAGVDVVAVNESAHCEEAVA